MLSWMLQIDQNKKKKQKTLDANDKIKFPDQSAQTELYFSTNKNMKNNVMLCF